MGVILFGSFTIATQYLCTSALIMICALLSLHLYVLRIKKSAAPETFSGLTEQSDLNTADSKIHDGADGENQPDMRPFAGNRTVQGRLNKSFTAKLIQSSDTIKQFYADLANEFLIYEKIRNRISWANSCFVAGRKNVSKVSIKGKTLYLYLALEPENFRDTKFYVSDASSVKRYETVPLRMKIKSRRGVKQGKELIEILMKKLGIVRVRDTAETVKPSDYPYETTKKLLQRGLIRLKTENGACVSEADCPVWADFTRRERVFATEVQNFISDEVAASLTEEREEKGLSKPKGIINIDTLSEQYRANDTVTLISLKEKKLIQSSVNYVKVLARGAIDKPLTVKLQEFSADAAKMILLTGGKVIRLKRGSKNANDQK